MGVKAGSFSVASAGNGSITGLTFLPTNIIFRMGPTTSATDLSVIARCDGWATALNSSYDSTFHDATGTEQKAGTGQCLLLRYRNAGTMTDKVAATWVSFDTITPGSNYGFTLNFTAADASKQIRYIASDA